ncbi:MAG TPA: ester cyclase [Solirubrobacteraceae bacterium]|nr:ester cyclase [Solirubrobacteraceae bacterium]
MTAVAASASAAPTIETVSRELETNLPPAPAFMAVARFTYDPGALFGPSQGAGPVVFRLLRGTLDFMAEMPVFLRRGGAAQPRQAMTPGQWFEVLEGDQLLVPGQVPHSAKSPGPRQAMMMGVAIFGTAPAQLFPPGIGFEPLVLGAAATFPREPVETSLTRWRFAGETKVHDAAGPELFHVESGSVTATVRAGDVTVAAAPGAPATEPIAPGSARTLGQGAGLSVQAGASLTLQGDQADLIVAAVCSADAARSAARNVARRYFYEIWGRGRLDLVDEVFAPQFVNRTPLEGQRPDRAGVRQFVQAVRSAFPDASVSLDLQVADTARVSNRYTLRGTHRGVFMGLQPTGRPIEITGITTFRLDDDRIHESWGYLELATLLAQIGKAPWGP